SKMRDSSCDSNSTRTSVLVNWRCCPLVDDGHSQQSPAAVTAARINHAPVCPCQEVAHCTPPSPLCVAQDHRNSGPPCAEVGARGLVAPKARPSGQRRLIGAVKWQITHVSAAPYYCGCRVLACG